MNRSASVIIILSILPLNACSTLQAEKSRVDKIRKVSVVGFSLEQQMPGTGEGLLKAITSGESNDPSVMGINARPADRAKVAPHGTLMYSRLTEQLAKRMGWQVVGLDEIRRLPTPQSGYAEDLLDDAVASIQARGIKSLILTNLDSELARNNPDYMGSMLMAQRYVYSMTQKSGFQDMNLAIAVRSPILRQQLESLGLRGTALPNGGTLHPLKLDDILSFHERFPRLRPYREEYPMGVNETNWRVYRQFWELPGF